MNYRRFQLPARALATSATDSGREEPGQNAAPATSATAATVSAWDPKVSRQSQVSQGVSCEPGPGEAQTVATVASGQIDDEDRRAAFDERAGHLEFSEHLPRAEAERIALAEMGERPRPP